MKIERTDEEVTFFISWVEIGCIIIVVFLFIQLIRVL